MTPSTMDAVTPRDELKAALKRGEQKTIARTLGVSPSVVNGVLHGTYPTPRTPRSAATVRRVQVALANYIGRSVDDVFSTAAIAA